jgi:RHS repeat-associated protein
LLLPTCVFIYDARDQLLGIDHSNQTDETYGYDDNGNRTTTGYQTGPNNQLLSDATYTYAYDQEGKRTSRINISTGEVTDYTWDYRNRLTGVTVRSGSVVTRQVDYTYDSFDSRITKVIDLDGAGAEGATTERYAYDGQHIAMVFDGQGNQAERYLHGPAVDQVLAGEVNGQTHWMLADHQGSIRQITDDAGNLLNQIDYDSYGNITSQSNPSVTFRFGYTGREWDGETGQYYYRARYYDPSVGQFISQDPIGFSAGDANLYRYVGNSPTNRIDPSGLQMEPITEETARRARLNLLTIPWFWAPGRADLFIGHYYEGNGKTVDLTDFGVLNSVKNNMEVQSLTIKEGSRIATEAIGKLGGRMFKSKTIPVSFGKEKLGNVNLTGSVFVLGKSNIYRSAASGEVKYNCNNNQITWKIKVDFSINERFEDPPDISEDLSVGRIPRATGFFPSILFRNFKPLPPVNIPPVEFPGGTAYTIKGSWSQLWTDKAGSRGYIDLNT